MCVPPGQRVMGRGGASGPKFLQEERVQREKPFPAGVISSEPVQPGNAASAEARSRAEQLFLSQLPHIERLISFICRRNQIAGHDAADFSSVVYLKLIEDDYRVLRMFQGSSRLTTYLTVVIQRILLDQRTEAWGKWRASAEAKRHGLAGVELEQLMIREGRPFEEAYAVVCRDQGPVSREDLLALSARLSPRKSRPVETGLDEASSLVGMDALAIERQVNAQEGEEAAHRAAQIISSVLAGVNAEDRLILRMRFRDNVTVADIARALHLEPKPLYKRIDRLLRNLRTALDAAALDRSVLLEHAGAFSIEFDLPTVEPSKRYDH